MIAMRIFYVSFTFLTLALFISGCSPREVIREDEEDAFADDLREYEREFNPSDYNEPFVLHVEEEEEPDEEPTHIPDIDEPDTPEYLQGFRIQLYSTSDMVAAQEIHNYADSLFIDHWIYVVYEVPFYKVRLGDFETRPQANRILAQVTDKGFRDAWIVPDRVVKDPPEKIIDEEIDDDEDLEENDELPVDELHREELDTFRQ